jgi:glycosyltransferase involved in cell wall biosynthesis
MVKVSVIICTQNRLMQLKSAIEDILNQTFQDFEIICVLGSKSKDNSRDFLTELKGKGMIKFVTNEGTRIDARNKGLSIATGEYVCFLDDDDSCIKNRLEVQSNYLDEHTDVDVVGCMTMIDQQSIITETFYNNDHLKIIQLLEDNRDIDHILNFQSCMFRKSIFDKYFDENYKPFEDLFIAGGEGQFLLYNLIINKGVHVANIQQTIYIYRVGAMPDSLSATTEPVFYNQYLYEKPWEDKKEFVRNFYTTFPIKIEKNNEESSIINYKRNEKTVSEESTASVETSNNEVQVVKKKRGRKKKAEIAISSETIVERKGDENTVKEKKKRGRPKKVKME